VSKKIAALIVSGLLVWYTQVAAAVQRIVVLHSYHQGLYWTDTVHRGIEAGLHDADSKPQVFTEYLESIRLVRRSPNRDGGMVDYLRAKYPADFPDVVIVSDDDAFNFMLRYREQVFPGKPLVYCGINNLKPADIVGRQNLTGVAEIPSFESLLKLMIRLQPAMRRVWVIGDKTVTFNGNRIGVAEAIKKIPNPPAVEYSTETRIDAIEAKLRGLSNDTGVLLAAKLEDESGNVLTVSDATRRVAAASPVPVFGPWEFRLGHGIIGGELVTGESQGRLAGQLAARLLRGEPIEQVRPVWDSPNQLMFDYRMLTRFGLSELDVPAQSVIVNKPPGFFQKYWLVLTLIFAAALSGLGVMQWRRIRVRNRINIDVLTARERDVVRWVALGKTNAEIALLLKLSENTVKHHLTSVFEKLHIYNRAQLVRRLNRNESSSKTTEAAEK
jgi:DNA-binding CsgD family transcriptional regulator